MTSHVTYVMVQTSCPTSVYCHSTDHYLTQEWPLNSLNCSPDLEYNDNVTCVLGMSVQPGRPASKYGCKAQTSFLTQKHIIVKTIGLSLMTWSREFLCWFTDIYVHLVDLQIYMYIWLIYWYICTFGWFTDIYVHLVDLQIYMYSWLIYRYICTFGWFTDIYVHLVDLQIYMLTLTISSLLRPQWSSLVNELV